mgnify:CR=1 FL=1
MRGFTRPVNYAIMLTMKPYIFVILALPFVASCRPMWLQMVDPAGPPEYMLGWEDGCDSGLSAEGGWTYKLMYGFKKRPELAASDQYKQGWNEGFTYCRFSLGSSERDSSFRSIGLGGGYD